MGALTRLRIAPLVVACACASPGPGGVAQPGVGAPVAPFVVQKGPGYIAHVHIPQLVRGRDRAPAVILIGGSGGGIGWQDYIAERLVQRGIVVMSVAYFGLDSLPKELDQIPLEGFEGALSWLASQRYVDRSRIGIGGVSKGAEAALLVAVGHPEIRAVAVFSPTAYVFQSVTRDFRRTSSWTKNGVEVPYVRYGNAPQGSALAEFYRSGVRSSSPDVLSAAVIPVERIKASLLLLAGRDDTLWGSGEWTDSILSRLKTIGSKVAVESMIYDDAGHLISSIRPDDVTYRGGTKAGNDFAQADGQRRFLGFLERNLK